MKKTNLLSLILVCFVSMCMAQTVQIDKQNSEFINKTYNSFYNFYKKGINEKLYIQTDKPYYSAGEKLWFKGYLVNSITHAPLRNTNFIYVQLTDKRDSLFTRVKIMADEFGFHNNIDLPNDMPEGEYTLTGYTKWMTNWDESFLFNKKVSIANPIDDAYTLYQTSFKPLTNGNLEISSNVKTSTGTIIEGTPITCEYYVKGKSKTAKTKVDSKGNIKFIIPQDRSVSTLNIISEVPDSKFTKIIYAPTLDDVVDIQFYPEGGHLLAEQLQSIVFKATGTDGKGRDVVGSIFNSNKEKVAEFNTEFKGMGRFSFFASAGDKYYAEVTDKANTTKVITVDLPNAVKSGCTIKTIVDKTNLIYQVVTTPDIDTKKIGIVLHSRGKIVNASLVGDNNKLKRINLNTLPEGILTITVVELKDYSVVSERLVFIPTKTAKATMKADRPSYSMRSQVNIDLEVIGADGKPVEGDFAVSVTDRNAVQTDYFTDNIVSNLLLTSDLQGYVDSPSDYFTDNKEQDMNNRELLMLTQGWKRFRVSAILKDSIPPLKTLPEKEHTITGNIRGFFGKDAKSPSLVIYNPKTKFLDLYPMGSTSRFSLEGMDYPDSTEVLIQGLSKRGNTSSLKIDVDEEYFPKPHYIYPHEIINREYKPFVPENYSNQSKERYYFEGGMRVIDLEAVTITAEAKQESMSLFDIEPTSSFTTQDIEDNQALTLYEALSLLSGVTVDGDNVYIRGGTGTPLLYVDDFVTDIEYLSTMRMSQVAALGILDGADALIYGPGSEAGVILIKLKEGASVDAKMPMPSLVSVKQLGYKKAERHYQPKYETPEGLRNTVPDVRTTISWNPFIQTGVDGKTSFSFYAADRDTSYDVTLEGVTKNGDVIRQQITVEKKN